MSSETPIQQHLSTTGGRFMLKESQLLFLHFRAIEGADNTGNVLPTKPSPPSLCSGFCDLIVAPHIILLLGGKCLYEERGSEQHNAWDCICLCVSTRRGFKVTYGRKVRHIYNVPVVMWGGVLYTRAVFKHITASCLWEGTQENCFDFCILSQM